MLYENAVSPELLELIIKLQGDITFKDYILSGGTALSLQLGHRKSIDIDLFTPNKQNNQKLIRFFQDNFSSYNLVYIDTYILQLIVRNISIDMVSINQNILEKPKTENGITLFGIKDIAAMKLRAVMLRNKPKDYIDIVYLLQEIPLASMFDLYKQKFNTDDTFLLKKTLAESDDIEKPEWQKVEMLNNNINIYEIPEILKNELAKYNAKHGIIRKLSLPGKIKKLFNR